MGLIERSTCCGRSFCMPPSIPPPTPVSLQIPTHSPQIAHPNERMPQERLQPHEWAAAATAGLGVLLLGASSEPEGGSAAAAAPTPTLLRPPLHSMLHGHPSLGGMGAPALDDEDFPNGGPKAGKGGFGGPAGKGLNGALGPAGPDPVRVLVTFLLLLSLLAFEVWWRQQRLQSKRRRHGQTRAAEEAADAAACGLEAGACFGFSAAACRTGFQLAHTMGWVMVPAGIAASIGLTSSGFVLQVRTRVAGPCLRVCDAVWVAAVKASCCVA